MSHLGSKVEGPPDLIPPPGAKVRPKVSFVSKDIGNLKSYGDVLGGEQDMIQFSPNV